MAGVRVQHPTERNVRYTVVEHEIVLDQPYQCTPPEYGGCGGTHLFKTHHLNVDETGSCIIGDVLYKKIRHHLEAEGFVEQNVVKRPPALGIGLAPVTAAGGGAWGNVPIIRGRGDVNG